MDALKDNNFTRREKVKGVEKNQSTISCYLISSVLTRLKTVNEVGPQASKRTTCITYGVENVL